MHHAFDYQSNWNDEKPKISWDLNNGKWIGTNLDEYAHIIGENILQNHEDIQYEVWVPELKADKKYSYLAESGLKHISFPAKMIQYRNGLSKSIGLHSNAMILELKRMLANNEQAVLHLNATPSLLTKMIVRTFANDFPIVAQFYTNLINFIQSKKTNNLLKKIQRFFVLRSNIQFYNSIAGIIPANQDNLWLLDKFYKGKIYYRDNLSNGGLPYEDWIHLRSNMEIRSKLDIPVDKFVIFSSSRLIPTKQIDKLIEVIAQLKSENIICYISGHGTKDYEKYLKKLVYKLNLEDKVKFIGFVDNEVLKDYYFCSDLFVSASKIEAGPITVFLALSSNTPVLVTNSGMQYEFLQEHNNDFVVSHSNYSTWSVTIDKIIDGKTKFNPIDYERVKDFLDWKKITAYYKGVFEDMNYKFYNKN